MRIEEFPPTRTRIYAKSGEQYFPVIIRRRSQLGLEPGIFGDTFQAIFHNDFKPPKDGSDIKYISAVIVAGEPEMAPGVSPALNRMN